MDFLAQQADVDSLVIAGKALWALVASNGVALVVGAGSWHLWLKRQSRLKAKR